MITENEAILRSNLHMENPRRPGSCVILHRNGYYRRIHGQLRIPMKFGRQFILVTDQMFPNLYIQEDCPFCLGVPKQGPAFSKDLATNPYFRGRRYHSTYMGQDK